ncbi:MAG: hypothetical protein ABIM89_13500 [Mycobacteriales bacterium]
MATGTITAGTRTTSAKPTIFAAAVLAASASLWTGLQAALAAGHGRESAAVVSRVAAQHPDFSRPDTGASYWGPLVLLGTVQFVALASLALVFVIAGRRRSWALLGGLLFVHPEPGNLLLSWLRPIGMGWTGPWVQDGIPVGEPIPSNVALYAPTAVGTVVDLLMIAAAAVAYVLLTRKAPRPALVPTVEVARRLALPLGLVAFASVGFGLVNPNGGDAARTVPLLVVPLAAALLATTRLPSGRAMAAVAVAAFAASPGVGYLVAPGLHGSWSAQSWTAQSWSAQSFTAMAGYAVPLALAAAAGALIAVHGPAIAGRYRRAVGRPASAQTA